MNAPTPNPPGRTRGTRFVFTVNNPTEEPTFDETKLRYLVFGSEVAPSTGTPHYQGYCESNKQITFVQLHSIPGFQHAHFQIARGSAKENFDYCSKDGTFKVFGTPKTQGQRNDLTHIVDILKTTPGKPGIKRVLEEHPGDYLRYHRGIEKAAELLAPPPKPLVNASLRPWQVDLMEILEEEPSARKIHFYVDPVGAAGKSWICRFIFSNNPTNCVVLSNGKHDRLLASYTGQYIVLFDFTRSVGDDSDYLPYTVIEHIKNGYKPPGMYGSPPCFYLVPHVIVFCNSCPKVADALSEDRYIIHQLSHAAYNPN